MKYETPINPNYVATIVKVNATHTLEGLDNLIGFNAFGAQALVSKDIEVGTVGILFTAETQLSEAFAKVNNLHRHTDRNADQSKAGYLEDNRRVRAIRLRGHQSDALFMSLDEVQFPTAKGGSWGANKANNSGFEVGDVFDKLDGVEICRKYLVKEPGTPRLATSKVRRVDLKVFPTHVDTSNYWRNSHMIPDDAQVIISQKLHGTSGRWGRVPVSRELSLRDKIAQRLGIKVSTEEMQLVSGSRMVVKSIDGLVETGKQDFYGEDLWSLWGEKIKDVIPDNYIAYGEIIGWTPDGKSIQKNYTYDLPVGESRLYIYRVAVVTAQGRVTDLSWAEVKMFAESAGLEHVPELSSGPHRNFIPEEWIDIRFADNEQKFAKTHPDYWGNRGTTTSAIQLSDPKSVDEGVAIRYDGPNGIYLLKAKSPIFLSHETKMLDAEVLDIESEESI